MCPAMESDLWPNYRVSKILLGKRPIYTIENKFIPNEKAPDSIGAGVRYISAAPAGEYQLVKLPRTGKNQRWCLSNPDLGIVAAPLDEHADWVRDGLVIGISNKILNHKETIAVGAHLLVTGLPDEMQPGIKSSALAVHWLNEYLAETKINTLVIEDHHTEILSNGC